MQLGLQPRGSVVAQACHSATLREPSGHTQCPSVLQIASNFSGTVSIGTSFPACVRRSLFHPRNIPLINGGISAHLSGPLLAHPDVYPPSLPCVRRPE